MNEKKGGQVGLSFFIVRKNDVKYLNVKEKRYGRKIERINKAYVEVWR